ncbi:hypothetical protein BH09DEP1_BH09DEP1_3660 [soil metagenome]
MKKIITLFFLSLSAMISANAPQKMDYKIGDSDVIQFASSPTDGKIWKITNLSEENIVKLEELSFEPNTELGEATGYQSWKITAMNTGRAQAVFELKQSGNPRSIYVVPFDFVVE